MKKTLAILALGLTAIAGHAATPLWMRDVQISPDGTEIAFCYKGDIYKVPAKGGTATQLTTQESYECTPHMVAGRQTNSLCQRQIRQLRRIRDAGRRRNRPTAHYPLHR